MCGCKMPFSNTHLNFIDLCRLCLSKDNILIPVFDNSLIGHQLSDKINVCLTVNIKTEDEVSQKICHQCLTKVNAFFDYRSTTLECQKVLQRWVSEANQSQLNKDSDKGAKEDSSTELNKTNETYESENDCDSRSSFESITSERIDEDDVARELFEKSFDCTIYVSEAANDPDYDRGSEVPSSVRSHSESINSERNDEDDVASEIDSFDCTVNVSEGDIVSPNSEVPGPSGLQQGQKQSPPIENNISLKRDGNQKEKSANLNSCPLCRKQFQNSETLQKHEEKHFGNIQCEICSKKFSSLKKLSIHSSRHFKKYICSFCNYASHSSSNFKIHLMKHNKQCLIECEDCGKGFYSLSYYREHRSVKHSNEIVINKCEFCQKAYHSKFYLNQHLKIHSPDFVKKTFQCELCGKTFQSWKGMKKHANSIHDRAKHKCDLCGKEVTCLQSLKNHKKIHSGEKSFVCDICGKGFIALNNLVVHERIHSGEKPYKCDQCDKSFSQQSTLKVHKRCHSGEKPYPCYQCNKRFITRSHMKKHEKTHKETEKNV